MEWFDNQIPENNMKEIKGKICVTYKFVTDVPKDWDKDKIEEDIKENLDEYVDNEYTIDDIFDIIGDV